MESETVNGEKLKWRSDAALKFLRPLIWSQKFVGWLHITSALWNEKTQQFVNITQERAVEHNKWRLRLLHPAIGAAAAINIFTIFGILYRVWTLQNQAPGESFPPILLCIIYLLATPVVLNGSTFVDEIPEVYNAYIYVSKTRRKYCV